MRWVKLDCLKSNGKLETEYSLDTTVEVRPMKGKRLKSEIAQLELSDLWRDLAAL